MEPWYFGRSWLCPSCGIPPLPGGNHSWGSYTSRGGHQQYCQQQHGPYTLTVYLPHYPAKYNQPYSLSYHYPSSNAPSLPCPSSSNSSNLYHLIQTDAYAHYMNLFILQFLPKTSTSLYSHMGSISITPNPPPPTLSQNGPSCLTPLLSPLCLPHSLPLLLVKPPLLPLTLLINPIFDFLQ